MNWYLILGAVIISVLITVMISNIGVVYEKQPVNWGSVWFTAVVAIGLFVLGILAGMKICQG